VFETVAESQAVGEGIMRIARPFAPSMADIPDNCAEGPRARSVRRIRK
jgi:hypothetical protein